MKIAVCFSGQMRTALAAAPNLLRFFGDLLPNIDFFIHTWDINQYRPYGSHEGKSLPWRPDASIGKKPIELLPAGILDLYRNTYNPKIMNVESYDDYVNTYECSPGKSYPILHYTWRKSMLYCLKYSLENNKQYDVVIKLRPDLTFPKHRKLLTEIDHFKKNDEVLYSHGVGSEIVGCPHWSGEPIDDVFWIGSFKTMALLSNFGDPNLNINAQCSFGQFVKSIRIDVRPFLQSGYAPLRPESLQYDALTQFNEIFYFDQFWYSNRAPREYILQEK